MQFRAFRPTFRLITGLSAREGKASGRVDQVSREIDVNRT